MIVKSRSYLIDWCRKMTRAIINPYGRVAVSDKSHQAGWWKLWARQLDADIVNDPEMYRNYDQLFIANDINGDTGVLNLFGFRADNEIGGNIKHRWSKIIESNAKISNLDYHQPHTDLFAKRKLGSLSDMYNNLAVFTQADVARKTGKAVIGDSHSISVAYPGYACLRHDGRTLKGALKRNMLQSLCDELNLNEIIVYFGNIDARFHWGQRDDTRNAAIEAANGLKWQCNRLRQKITITELLPQTNDDRKIPKSGQLNGENFYGNREDRQAAVEAFNEAIRASRYDTITWPFGDELTKDVMEMGGSVHLAPRSYQW